MGEGRPGSEDTLYFTTADMYVSLFLIYNILSCETSQTLFVFDNMKGNCLILN